MIRYNLKCANDHRFESWFQSAAAFDSLHKAGHVTCPECGSGEVEKALMAPPVRPGRKAPAAPPEDPAPSLTAPETEKERALAELRRKIEDNSDYVGMNFAAEARAMHDGNTPHRSIYGEAKPDDAKKLLEDGVPVAPLPFTPKARTT